MGVSIRHGRPTKKRTLQNKRKSFNSFRNRRIHPGNQLKKQRKPLKQPRKPWTKPKTTLVGAWDISDWVPNQKNNIAKQKKSFNSFRNRRIHPSISKTAERFSFVLQCYFFWLGAQSDRYPIHPQKSFWASSTFFLVVSMVFFVFSIVFLGVSVDF